MAETPPATTQVTDRRSEPKGVLPRSAQTWLMVGLAFGILGIIFVTGRPVPPESRNSVAPERNTPPSAERALGVKEHLRRLEEAARRDMSTEEPSPPAAHPVPVEQTLPPPDPLAAEKQRREYESLFAGVLVATRRPHEALPAPPGDAGTGRASAEASARDEDAIEAGRPVPSLDAVADAILRANARQGAPAVSSSPVPSLFQPPGSAPRPTLAASSGDQRYRVPEGTVVQARLKNRIDGAAPSPVDCLVTEAVYSEDRQHLLIPAGARVLGQTKPIAGRDASRLEVTFHRLLQPNSLDYALADAVALNQAGDARLRGDVNRHDAAMFGVAAAMGLITGLAQGLTSGAFAGGSRGGTVVVAGGVGDTTSQATGQALNRFTERLPTITVPEGHPVLVYLTRDLELPAYSAQPPLPGAAAATSPIAPLRP